MKKIAVADLAGAMLVFLFGYAGLSKLLTYPVFIAQIGKSPLIPAGRNHLFGIVVILLEFLCVFLLLRRDNRIKGFYLSFFLMSLFSAYVYYILHIGYYIPCSCGGILQNMGWELHLYFNLFFVLISLAGIFKTQPAL